MIRDAIILAGGLGTRLRGAVPDLPKCMAPVRGRPFLDFVIDHLQKEGIEHFIFSLGYMHEKIEEHLKKHYPELSYACSVEKEPMGTGGAIKLACTLSEEKNVLIANGDTLFKIDAGILSDFHIQHAAACTLALKPMKDFDRYGAVELDNNNHIRSFSEKKHYASGLINGGIYALRPDSFLSLGLPDKFSFEKEFLEVYFGSMPMFGIIQDNYFIDIGIPEDYERAEKELEKIN